MADVSPGEFETIPKYLCGRMPLGRINNVIGGFNKALQEKYTLLARYTDSSTIRMSVSDRQRCMEWRQQAGDDESTIFVSETDLKAHLKMDPVSRNVLTILRQLGRLREVRTPGLVKYVLA